MPMLQRMFGGGGGVPGANLGQFQGSQGPIYTRLTRPQGAGGMGSLLAALPTILSAAPGIIKAVTTDPGFKTRMKQDRQNQLAAAEPTTPPTTAATAAAAEPAANTPPTTIPPVTPTQPVIPTTSATVASGNTGGRVNMPTQPGDTGGRVQYSV